MSDQQSTSSRDGHGAGKMQVDRSAVAAAAHYSFSSPLPHDRKENPTSFVDEPSSPATVSTLEYDGYADDGIEEGPLLRKFDEDGADCYYEGEGNIGGLCGRITGPIQQVLSVIGVICVLIWLQWIAGS